MAIFLKRDTKVYLEKVSTNTVIWEIPVMDGFSFSQGNTTSEVTLNEMANNSGYSKRGRRMFNDALAPAEWSISTYVRPFKSTVNYADAATSTGKGAGSATNSNNTHAIEEALWANFVGKGGWTQSATGIATVTNGTLAGGIDGIYEIDQGEYTTSGSGFGATFRITITDATSYSVVVVNPGSGYAATDTIAIPGSALGGSGNITLTVATLTSTENNTYDTELENFVRGTAAGLNIYSTGSNTSELGTFNLYFVMGATNSATMNYTAGATVEIYKLSNCVVNEATINFEVDGIAMIDWSGSATTLTTASGFDARDAITEGITKTDNFIRNKLTALEIYAGLNRSKAQFAALPGTSQAVSAAVAGTNGLVTNRLYRINTLGTLNFGAIGAAGTPAVGDIFIYNGVTTTGTGTVDTGIYNLVLTGGSITLSNNITYLTPEVLGIVNQPIGHITGNKSITGNFTAYVDGGVTGDSADLFEKLTGSDARSIITNSFNLTFRIGGTTGKPRLEVNLPTAHLEIPNIQSEDIISVDVAFHGLPSTITQSDEYNLTYIYL